MDNAAGDDNPATGSDDIWDFGTSGHYPVLKVDFDGDGAATWQEFGIQRLNSAPEFPATETGARSVAENTSAGASIGGPVAATDADNDALTYRLGGTGAASFDIEKSSGQLRTKAALDFETRASYSVTVSVHDGKDARHNANATTDATMTVTVAVTNVDEDGAVTLPSAQAQGWNGANGRPYRSRRQRHRRHVEMGEFPKRNNRLDGDRGCRVGHLYDGCGGRG